MLPRLRFVRLLAHLGLLVVPPWSGPALSRLRRSPSAGQLQLSCGFVAGLGEPAGQAEARGSWYRDLWSRSLYA